MTGKNCGGRAGGRAVWLVMFAASALVLGAGCGKGKGDLRGTVEYDGKKLAMGQVWVLGSDNLPYYGVIKDDGSYVVSGVPTGTCKIAVSSESPGSATSGRGGGERRDPGDQLPGDPKKWFAIPEAYNAHATSQLTYEVQRGDNAHDIKLVKK